MNRAEAHAVLDAAKAGARVSKRDITAALFFTGDIRSRPIHTERSDLIRAWLKHEVRPVPVDKSWQEAAE